MYKRSLQGNAAEPAFHDRPQSGQHMAAIRSFAMTAAALVAVGAGVPAQANGTVRIVKTSGSDRMYSNVRIHVYGMTSLRLASADGRNTLTIHHAACSYIGELRRCLPYRFTLDERGKSHVIELRRGTLYINETDSELPMPHSSMHVAAHGVVLSLLTARGTMINATGKIDGAAR